MLFYYTDNPWYQGKQKYKNGIQRPGFLGGKTKLG